MVRGGRGEIEEKLSERAKLRNRSETEGGQQRKLPQKGAVKSERWKGSLNCRNRVRLQCRASPRCRTSERAARKKVTGKEAAWSCPVVDAKTASQADVKGNPRKKSNLRTEPWAGGEGGGAVSSRRNSPSTRRKTGHGGGKILAQMEGDFVNAYIYAGGSKGGDVALVRLGGA